MITPVPLVLLLDGLDISYRSRECQGEGLAWLTIDGLRTKMVSDTIFSQKKIAVEARLLKIAEKATQAVENAVNQGNLTASLAVLRGMGMLSGTPVRPSSGDPEDLRQAAVLAQEEDDLARPN